MGHALVSSLVRGDSATDHVLVSSLGCLFREVCYEGFCKWLDVPHCEAQQRTTHHC